MTADTGNTGNMATRGLLFVSRETVQGGHMIAETGHAEGVTRDRRMDALRCTC